MTNPHGSFIWYELITADPAAAADFYGAVVGWQAADAGVPGMDYRILSHQGDGVAGIMTLPPAAGEAGMRAGWFGYLGVGDVDAAVDAVVAAGGRIHMEAQDIPSVGRLAMVADPQGVPFYLMRGESDAQSAAFHPKAVGRVSWNELVTPDQAAALGFYCGQYGWERAGEMPMGELGSYVFLAHNGQPIGAVMNAPPGQDRPKWNFYIRVGDIDAAAERVRAAGGRVLQGPMEVPGDDFVVDGEDPQGVKFGLVGSRS
jgi:predicted enzyme related to lactoylglutathione lyase